MNTLADVVRFAGLARSLHDSQPWRRRVTSSLELFLERRRVLPATDADGRLAVLSCGAAPHHASLLRPVDMTRFPGPDDPDLPARLTLRDDVPVDVDAARLAEAAPRRRIDRRVTPGESVDLHRVRSVRAAVLDWLIAGEALSAGRLTATDLGLGVLPLSVVTEVAGSRDRIRKLLGGAGYPHLVPRFAAAGDAAAPGLPLEGIVRR